MISDEYRNLNASMHKAMPEYGSGGKKYAEFIKEAMARTGSKTVLDYGCGKGSLKKALGDFVTNYDPCVPEFSEYPDPADLVICTDVLEHVEPDKIDDVLDHIRVLSTKAAFFVISLRKAHKVLDDGRNAHLIVETSDWWFEKINDRFKVITSHLNEEALMVVCK